MSVESCTCGMVIRQLTRRSATEVTVVHFSASLIKFVFQTQCQLNDLPDLRTRGPQLTHPPGCCVFIRAGSWR